MVALFGWMLWSDVQNADAYTRAAKERAQWRWENIIKPQADQCYKLGGLPVFSAWDGEVKECKKP